MKRETRAGKAYVYQMVLNFKTSVAYIIVAFFNFTMDNCFHWKAVFVRYNSIFDEN